MTERLDDQGHGDKVDVPTPRVDAKEFAAGMASDKRHRVVDAGLARQLERELADERAMRIGITLMLNKAQRSMGEPVAEVAGTIQSAGTRTIAVTQDGPLGGWTTIGQEATELDFMLTQFQSEVEADADPESDPDGDHAAHALKLKREIIERYTPRSATERTAEERNDALNDLSGPGIRKT